MSGSLYLLRHEERNKSDISFDSPLTEVGLQNARTKVCGKLAPASLDIIYCSPYLRTLQTIQPHCVQTGAKVNLDWSIAELMPADAKYYPQFHSIVNEGYQSFTPYQASDESGAVRFDDIAQRVGPFLDSLDRNKNILLVTHLPIINVILSLKGFRWIELYSHHEPGSVIKVDRL